MDKNISYHKMKTYEINEVSRLVEEVFNEFVAPEYSENGTNTFLDFIKPSSIEGRLKREDCFILTAKHDENIVGAIEIKECSHISLLFVHKNYQKKGIAKNLFLESQKICLKLNPDIRSITVNSSPYALKIYTKLGFKQTAPKKEKNGIRFFPMVYKF